jgi:hypothetical protein
MSLGHMSKKRPLNRSFKKINPQKLDAIKTCLTQTSNDVRDTVDIQSI